MKNLYIYCEGPTEESFINNILTPYLLEVGIYSRPIICMTKRTKTRKHKGGVSDYRKIRTELSILCKQHKNETVTTMFDYYGFPTNVPTVEGRFRSIYEKVSCVERVIETDIDAPNLFFNLTLHEFEGLLFSNTSAFSSIADADAVAQLQTIREQFTTPEHINDSVDSAPSKRIKNLIPGYAKVRDGTIVSTRIGVESIISECEHFREWVSKIRMIVK